MQNEASIFVCPTCGSNGTCQAGEHRSFFGIECETSCPHYVTQEQARILQQEREQAMRERFILAKKELEHKLKKTMGFREIIDDQQKR